MALGGWLSGEIFDWTGSYRAAFTNGLAWNLLNVAIAASRVCPQPGITNNRLIPVWPGDQVVTCWMG
jgi:hypothetical protein